MTGDTTSEVKKNSFCWDEGMGVFPFLFYFTIDHDNFSVENIILQLFFMF